MTILNRRRSSSKRIRPTLKGNPNVGDPNRLGGGSKKKKEK